MEIRVSNEEKIMIDTICNRLINFDYDFNDIDYDKLVVLASGHLMIPTLFVLFEKYNVLNKIPQKLKVYLGEIYKLNEERNKVIIEESNEISNLFNDNDIKFQFIKGVLNLRFNMYEKIGERMIGDIDLIIEKTKMNNAIDLLKKNNYSNKYEYKCWNTKHPPRFTNKKKLMAIEPHSRIFNKKEIYFEENKLYELEEIQYNQILSITILNYQINDFGYLKASISYRTIYDVLIILKKSDNIDLILKNKFIKKFFLLTNALKITDVSLKTSMNDKIYLLRFLLKRKVYIFYIIDELICKMIIEIPKKTFQFIEFIINNKYRDHVLKNFSNFY